jgi:Raf kinase inhibitor-like YbhB/YbcL family protein
MALTLTSDVFFEGDTIPKKYTCDGDNISPELEWEGSPDAVRSFALIMHDPDAPKGDFTHWMLWDIPQSTESLPEGAGSASVGISGKNSFGEIGYGGPCPPPGGGPHRYVFELYALDVASLELFADTQRPDLDAILEQHTLAKAQLTGIYERK